MYFYKIKGGQHLDLSGNLILSHNDTLIKARVSSAAPKGVKHAKYVLNVSKLSFWKKVSVIFSVIRFVWGPSTALMGRKNDQPD